jgi:LCP family protein required for cell wall assembly
MTYLVLGSDSRKGISADQRQALGDADEVAGARADLVLVVRVFDDGRAPFMLSIPRDLLVLNESNGITRLALEFLSGPQAVVDTLCRTIGVGVDHVAIVDFAGFEKLVDEVGGIDITLTRPLGDQKLGFSFPEGRNHLDGRGALTYVRARHLVDFDGVWWVPHDPADDRGTRARVVLEAVAKRSDLSITDPFGTSRLVAALADTVAIDRSMHVSDLRRFADSLRRLSKERQLRLPSVAHDGPIPWAELEPGSGQALRPFVGGSDDCKAHLSARAPT